MRQKEAVLKDLIILLTALKIYCKDAHYAFKGEGFKSLHEWADEIGEPLEGYLDEMKENWFLFAGIDVPRGVMLNNAAVDYVPIEVSTNEGVLNNLLALITMCHNHLMEIDAKEPGINDLLGRLDTHLMKHIALLNLALNNVKDASDVDNKND